MLKKSFFLQISLLFIPLIHSAYAYQIDQNLTIENKTNLPLYFNFEPSQTGSGKYIRPHEKVEIPFNNGGWGSGLLYKPYTVPFTIKDAGTGVEYIRGRVAFYSQRCMGKYCFDSVSQEKALTSIKFIPAGRGELITFFHNKVVIEGNPEGAAPVQQYTDTIRCDGLQSATPNNSWNLVSLGEYSVTCHDKSGTSFQREPLGNILECLNAADFAACVGSIRWTDENRHTIFPYYYVPAKDYNLNTYIGNKYCESWEK